MRANYSIKKQCDDFTSNKPFDRYKNKFQWMVSALYKWFQNQPAILVSGSWFWAVSFDIYSSFNTKSNIDLLFADAMLGLSLYQ